MPPKDDFASLMEATDAGEKSRAKRLTAGQIVEGTVLHIGQDSVFVDIGGMTEARIDRGELVDETGSLKVAVGDRLRATLVDASIRAPRLSLALGRAGAVDLGALSLARDSQTPVLGKVERAVKGGLEVDLSGVRAFCPASQVELGYTEQLASYEGQTLEFIPVEIAENGRRIVVSRRALLEKQRRDREQELRERIEPGAELDAVVRSVVRHGAIVDVGGVDGFVHISELATHRVDRVEDVVQVGQNVKVRVLSIDTNERGLRLRLSMKDPSAVPEAPALDEVLEGQVVRVTHGGVIVSTSKGDGLVPLRELPLSPGADHRRAFPPGTALTVVVQSRDPANGRLRLSVTGVAAVEERRNYREFAAGPSSGGAGGFGSLGDVLRARLGLPNDAPAAPPATRERPEPPSEPASAPREQGRPPGGVVRRRR